MVGPPQILPLRFSVGIDLVRISETKRSLDCFGDRFLQRIFTATEIAVCRATPLRLCERLSTRFAAKEATMKVLRPRCQLINWRHIEVRPRPDGSSELALSGDAARLAAEAGVVDLSLSMSHEGDYATAIVMATRAPTGAAKFPSEITSLLAPPPGDHAP
jgi:holo-[acyl-carrier protein] synthase